MYGVDLATALNPPAALNGIDPVAALKPVGGARGEAQRFLLQLDTGQVVSARVEAELPDGSFKVQLAGRELRMALPGYVAAGDTLELTFVSNDPRPTFALRDPQAAGAPRLSAAGRLVATMMTQPGRPAVLAAATNTAPLLAALPANGAALSASLEQTLTQSGLFYEAHQAEWLAGKHDLAQLRTEPQASFAQSPRQLPALLADDAVVAAPLAGTATAPRTEQLPQSEGSALLQQQLAALESGKIVLQLEVWPRQWVQWEIEEKVQQSPPEPGTPSSWQTRLRLDLPRLGELNAVLTLDSKGVQIRLDSASAASAALLLDQRACLHAALAEAGMTPAGIAIARHEPV
jgi:hypothetical protein